MKSCCWCMKWRADELIRSRPTRYLIDYRNNEHQSRRHEEPIAAVHSLHSRRELLIRLHAPFFCYRSASWMNARWTFESKPSWPRSYWSCRYWHHWYTRSVSEALLQCCVRRKMQWRQDKTRSVTLKYESFAFSSALWNLHVWLTRVDN